ncbi:hypothetical protein [Actinokineospora sp.]|uniref:hypothetical protein n=1 Tax=Actinokineospora sp. TaxID=1872133 RepID=UPI003D6BE26D
MRTKESRPDVRSDVDGPARWALASLALSALLPSLGISIANVALPTPAEVFSESFREVQWVRPRDGQDSRGLLWCRWVRVRLPRGRWPGVGAGVAGQPAPADGAATCCADQEMDFADGRWVQRSTRMSWFSR